MPQVTHQNLSYTNSQAPGASGSLSSRRMHRLMYLRRLDRFHHTFLLFKNPLNTQAFARHTTIRCARGEDPSLVLLTSLVLFNTRGDGRNYRPDM